MFSILQLVLWRSRFTALSNTNENHRILFYCLVAVLVTTAISSLGLLINKKFQKFSLICCNTLLFSMGSWLLAGKTGLLLPLYGSLQLNQTSLVASIIALTTITISLVKMHKPATLN
jgi:hypothetical protein